MPIITDVTRKCKYTGWSNLKVGVNDSEGSLDKNGAWMIDKVWVKYKVRLFYNDNYTTLQTNRRYDLTGDTRLKHIIL